MSPNISVVKKSFFKVVSYDNYQRIFPYLIFFAGEVLIPFQYSLFPCLRFIAVFTIFFLLLFDTSLNQNIPNLIAINVKTRRDWPLATLNPTNQSQFDR